MAAEAAATSEELPKAIVRRLVKEKLSQLSSEGGDITLHKEALQAFSESARIFIHYLSATANDLCKESRRQTVNADDVLKALEEIEFSEFTGPLRSSLDEYRKKNAGKRANAAKAKESNKKQKSSKEAAAAENRGSEPPQTSENGGSEPPQTSENGGSEAPQTSENGGSEGQTTASDKEDNGDPVDD